jgi:hypothetical protein
MSQSEYKLTVTAGDQLAEISVINGILNPVAKSVGRLSKTLPGGLYKVFVRVGCNLDEQLVSLDQDRELRFGAPDIPSPIPLASSSKSHEYHRTAAMEAAATVRDTFGAGASILVFAREWSPGSAGSRDNPVAGLQFLDEHENVLTSIEERADVRCDNDPSAGWRCDVTPGPYRLRLDLPDGTSNERALYAAPQTQTQIFLLQRDYRLRDGTKKRRADLAGGTVAISTDFGFDPYSQRTRLSELACYALTQTHHILSDSLLSEVLEEKFDNPMLGLLGAHLVLRDHPQDARLFQVVTDNLLRLLGPDHPDLQALWLRREQRGVLKEPQLRTPPMLRRSWDLVMEESVRRPDVIPSDSTSNSVMVRILPVAPWLVWRGDGRKGFSIDAPEADLPITVKALVDLLATRARSDAERATAMKGTIERLITSLRAILSRVKAAIARGPASAPARSHPTPPLSDEDKVEIARVLGVSGRVINETLQRVFH